MKHIMKRIIVWSVLVSGACVTREKPDVNTAPPVVVPPVVVDDPTFPQQCADIWQQELGRAIDSAGLAGCLDQFRRGDSGETIRAGVRLSAEYRQRQSDIANAIENAKRFRPFTLDGRTWQRDGREQYPLLASDLSPLVLSAAERGAVLDEIKAHGYDSVRVFAGHLTWTTPVQTVEIARAVLPVFMDEAAQRGLSVLVVAVTDSRAGGYDVTGHLQAIAEIVRGRSNLLGVTCANELWHPSQSDLVNDAAALDAVCRPIMERAGIRWDLGAPEYDEPQGDVWPIPSGSFITLHLDRGRDKWNQIRRVRELFEVMNITRKSVINAEMLGADEVDGPVSGKQRSNDPSLFFAAGVLGAGFKIPSLFHSESGRWSRTFGPVQAECSRAFVAGFHAIPHDFQGRYVNTGQVGSPVRGAHFTDVGGPVVRAYSFVSGDQAYTVVLHTSETLPADAVTWADGWHAEARPGRPHVSIFWSHR